MCIGSDVNDGFGDIVVYQDVVKVCICIDYQGDIGDGCQVFVGEFQDLVGIEVMGVVEGLEVYQGGD